MILGAGPSHALHFGVYEWCKKRFGGDRVDGQGRVFGVAAAAAVATICAEGLMNPFDGEI